MLFSQDKHIHKMETPGILGKVLRLRNDRGDIVSSDLYLPVFSPLFGTTCPRCPSRTAAQNQDSIRFSLGVLPHFCHNSSDSNPRCVSHIHIKCNIDTWCISVFNSHKAIVAAVFLNASYIVDLLAFSSLRIRPPLLDSLWIMWTREQTKNASVSLLFRPTGKQIKSPLWEFVICVVIQRLNRTANRKRSKITTTTGA